MRISKERQKKKTDQKTLDIFRYFYDDNESGGSSRWLVTPNTVEIFLRSSLNRTEQQTTKRLIRKIKKMKVRVKSDHAKKIGDLLRNKIINQIIEELKKDENNLLDKSNY